jgi:putative nucleotidyltransferase-like protein
MKAARKFMAERRVFVGNTGTSAEAELLVSCTRARINEHFSDRIRSAARQKIDWMALVRLAMCHDVMPLLFRNLQRACPDSVPQDIMRALGARYTEQEGKARRRAEELVRVLALFEEQGIVAVPYKGPTLGQRLYGDISLREFGDLDIMIRERDVLRAQAVIRRNGYDFRYDFVSLKDDRTLAQYLRTDREVPFCQPNGEMLELHWRFVGRPAYVEHDPERFLERFEMVSLAGAQVPSLPLEVYFLVLSLHATKHRWRQLKLICDIAEILGQTGLDWQYVLREADDLGLKRMLAVGVLLAEDPLGVEAPRALAQGLKIDRVARALAGEVRRSLFEEPDEDWLLQADYRFQFRIRERLQDRATMFFQNLLPRLAPNERDRRFLALPESLSTMYYFVRPLRVAWERMTEPKLQRANKESS